MKRKWKRLALTEVSPSGWLKEQMKMQMDGLTGCLYEKWDSVGAYSGWLGGTGESWERGPYYLDGLLPLSYYLKDGKRWEICRKFLDWTLKSQDSEGNFGPERTKQDYWSRFIMLKVMLQYYEITGDEVIVGFIENYLKYLRRAIESRPLTGWAQARAGEALYVIKWLYERSPEGWMMDLQREIRRQAIDWSSLFADFPYPRPTAHYYNWDYLSRFQNEEVMQLMQYHQTHVVNVSMGLKYAAMEYFFDGNEGKKEQGIEALGTLEKYHGVACGAINGDEHLSGGSPAQGAELCGVAEQMFSLEAMLEVFGEPGIADRLERVAFNAYPAAISEDYMSHQYLQQANQILVSRAKRNWFNNGDDSNLFGLEPNFGCCTANMHQGWPKLVQCLWFWEENYLVSAVLAPNHLHTLAEGKRIEIDLETDYPFGETLVYRIRKAETAVHLKIRIPGWCTAPEIVAGDVAVRREGKDYWIVENLCEGNRIEIRYPMPVRFSKWYRDSVAVERGSLVYALKMEENWEKERECCGIADYSVHSPDAWNYALNLQELPETDVLERGANPFSHAAPPSQIIIKAKRVKAWKMVHNSAGPLPDSPVSSDEKEEQITLIPYGATALRISQFPYY